MIPRDDGYGSMMREVLKKSMSRPSGYRPSRMIPTWWDRNGELIRIILWSVATLGGFCCVILAYGMAKR